MNPFHQLYTEIWQRFHITDEAQAIESMTDPLKSIMQGCKEVIEKGGGKRYLVFCGEAYYPEGGWDDFQSAYDDLEEAQAFAKDVTTIRGSPRIGHIPYFNWAEIVDTHMMLIVNTFKAKEE